MLFFRLKIYIYIIYQNTKFPRENRLEAFSFGLAKAAGWMALELRTYSSETIEHHQLSVLVEAMGQERLSRGIREQRELQHSKTQVPERNSRNS